MRISLSKEDTLQLMLGFGVSFAIYWLYDNRALFSDEASFCTIAQGLLRGELPYQNYFNEKGPMHYYLTAVVMKLFGPGIAGGRIASGILLALTLGTFLLTLRHRQVGFATSLLWLLAVPVSGLGMGIYHNTSESLLALCSILTAVTLLSNDEHARQKAWIVGMAHGIACGARQTMLLPALLLLAWPWNDHACRRNYLLGIAAGSALWITPLALTGTWNDYLTSCIYFHWDNPHAGTYFRAPYRNEYPVIAAWAAAALCACLLSLHNKRNLHYLTWALALAFPFFGRMDAFRLWPSFIALCMLIAATSPTPSRPLKLMLLLVAMLATIGLYFQDPWRDFGNIRNVAARVQALTNPRDAIWAGPFVPAAYCLADRPSASRFYFILPWLAKESVKRQLLEDLARTQPKIIIDIPGHHGGTEMLAPGFDAFIRQEYRLLETIGDAHIYQRKDHGA